jgi:hypothetical protein
LNAYEHRIEILEDKLHEVDSTYVTAEAFHKKLDTNIRKLNLDSRFRTLDNDLAAIHERIEDLEQSVDVQDGNGEYSEEEEEAELSDEEESVEDEKPKKRRLAKSKSVKKEKDYNDPFAKDYDTKKRKTEESKTPAKKTTTPKAKPLSVKPTPAIKVPEHSNKPPPVLVSASKKSFAVPPAATTAKYSKPGTETMFKLQQMSEFIKSEPKPNLLKRTESVANLAKAKQPIAKKPPV